MKYKKALIGLIALVVLCPLGLLASGTAWGEWGLNEMQDILGYVPQGLSKLADINHIAFLPDYSVPAFGESLGGQAAGYYISAIVGIIIITALAFGIGRIIARK